LWHKDSGRHGPVGAAFPGQEGSSDRIDFKDEDGQRCHLRGGADNNDKQQERSFDNARQQQRRQGCHAESIILSALPAESLILSAHAESIVLSACAESIILSAPSLKPYYGAANN
jgi:hypothetical protein